MKRLDRDKTIGELTYFLLRNSNNLEEELERLSTVDTLIDIRRDDLFLSDYVQYVFKDNSYVTFDRNTMYYGINYADILHGGE